MVVTKIFVKRDAVCFFFKNCSLFFFFPLRFSPLGFFFFFFAIFVRVSRPLCISHVLPRLPPLSGDSNFLLFPKQVAFLMAVFFSLSNLSEKKRSPSPFFTA